MRDQAEKLRTLMLEKSISSFTRANKEQRDSYKRARIVAVTSGKGGAGKTNVAVNLAVGLRRRARKVLIMDMDLGLANVDLLIDADIRYSLAHVVNGSKRLQDIIVKTTEGVDIVGGAAGIESLANIGKEKQERLLKELVDIEHMYDFIIIDTGAGISNKVMTFVRSADNVVLVTIPEQPSILDAYIVLKLLSKTGQANGVGVIINMCSTEGEGKYIFERLAETTRRRLGSIIHCLGILPFDPVVREAVRSKKPFYIMYPNSPVSKAMDKILSNELWGNGVVKSRRMSFFKKIFNIIKR